MSNRKIEREVFWQTVVITPTLFVILSLSWAISRDWTTKGLKNLTLLNGAIGTLVGVAGGGLAHRAVKQAREETKNSFDAVLALPEDKQRTLRIAEKLQNDGIKLEEL
jgi:hypothetical protein